MIIKINIAKRGRNKTQDQQVIHNAIAHDLLTDAQTVPKQWPAPSNQLSICILGTM